MEHQFKYNAEQELRSDRFFEAFECLTIAEFKLVTPASVLENLRPAGAP